MIKSNLWSTLIQNQDEKPTINSQISKNEQPEPKPPLISLVISNRTRFILVLTTLFIIFCDQISKIWASVNLSMARPVNVIGDFIRVYLVHNSGMIWGIPVRSSIVYYVLPIIGIVVVLYIAFKTQSKLYAICYGLLLGGAIGNLIDRIRLGYVIDFIDMGIKNIRWPTYNIADLATVIGVLLIIAKEILNPHKHNKIHG